MGVSALPAEGLSAKALGIHDNVVANSTTFPAPVPPPADFLQDTEALAQAIATAKVNGGKPAYEAKRIAYQRVQDNIRQWASYVQLVSDGDEAIIKLSGFEVVERGAPVGQLPPPQLLRYRLTTTTGRVSLVWAKQDGADMHHVFMSTSNSPYNWQLVGTPAKCRFNMDGLTPGVMYYFAVTAIGAAGESSKSEPCQVMAAQ